MKRIVTLVFLMVMCLGINAQDVKFGVKAGYNASHLSGMGESFRKDGFTGGFLVEKPLNNFISLQTELLFTTGGGSLQESNEYDDRESLNLSFLNLPVLAKIYLAGGLNLQFGCQFGYLLTAKFDDGVDMVSVKRYSNRYNVGLVAGIAYDFSPGVFLETRYNAGLTDLNAFSDDEGKIKMGSVAISLGLKF